MRRLQERNRSRAQFRERWFQEPHLANPWLLDQQFDQCAQWPAATGKLGRQGHVAGINRPAMDARELRPAPKTWVNRLDVLGQGGHGMKHCMDVQYRISKSSFGKCPFLIATWRR